MLTYSCMELLLESGSKISGQLSHSIAGSISHTRMLVRKERQYSVNNVWK